MPFQPNVIARLMGMDATIAEDAPPIIQPQGTTNHLIPASETQTTSRKPKCSLLSHHSSINGDYYRHCLKKIKPRKARSRHRHPQEERLQKIRHEFQAWQSSKALENATSVDKPLEGRYIQVLAQERLHKEKMARYGYGEGNTKIMESKVTLSNNVAHHGNSEAAFMVAAKSEEGAVKVPRVSHCAESEKLFRALEEAVKGGEHDPSSSISEKLTRIAILKPSSSRTDVDDDHRQPLFGSPKVKRDGNMEEFLQEVKERLKKELKVNTGSEVMPIWERHTARDMAKQIRDTVSKEYIGKRLSRSVSFRAFRGDRKRAATAKHASLSCIGSDEQSCTSDQISLMKRKVDSVPPIDDNAVSPRVLVRSFSAPASGMSQVRSHAGASDTASEGAAVTTRSSSFSLRGTVSSLWHSFSLGGKLLMHWSKKPSPQASGHFTVAQANFTELPPSTMSPLEIEGRHFFGDLRCAFPELSPRCSSEVEAPTSDELSCKTNADTESNRDKSYIRQVLITAGLCDDDGSSSNKGNSTVDSISVARLICDDIFDEVEAAHYCHGGDSDDHDEDATDHRMLFDLANEALQILDKNGSSLHLHRWVVDGGGGVLSAVDGVWQQVEAMRKKNLPVQTTIDGMVACEVRRSEWLEVLHDHEDVYAVGRKIERAIFHELIGDILQ